MKYHAHLFYISVNVIHVIHSTVFSYWNLFTISFNMNLGLVYTTLIKYYTKHENISLFYWFFLSSKSVWAETLEPSIILLLFFSFFFVLFLSVFIHSPHILIFVFPYFFLVVVVIIPYTHKIFTFPLTLVLLKIHVSSDFVTKNSIVRITIIKIFRFDTKP